MYCDKTNETRNLSNCRRAGPKSMTLEARQSASLSGGKHVELGDVLMSLHMTRVGCEVANGGMINLRRH